MLSKKKKLVYANYILIIDNILSLIARGARFFYIKKKIDTWFPLPKVDFDLFFKKVSLISLALMFSVSVAHVGCT